MCRSRVVLVEALVDLAVAIVVLAVAQLGDPRVHLRVLVVAIGGLTERGAGGVTVAVGVEALVDLAVAVVVSAVADLGRTGMDGAIVIIAIERERDAVAIGIGRHRDALTRRALRSLGAGRARPGDAAVFFVQIEGALGAIRVSLRAGWDEKSEPNRDQTGSQDALHPAKVTLPSPRVM